MAGEKYAEKIVKTETEYIRKSSTTEGQNHNDRRRPVHLYEKGNSEPPYARLFFVTFTFTVSHGRFGRSTTASSRFLMRSYWYDSLTVPSDSL